MSPAESWSSDESFAVGAVPAAPESLSSDPASRQGMTPRAPGAPSLAQCPAQQAMPGWIDPAGVAPPDRELLQTLRHPVAGRSNSLAVAHAGHRPLVAHHPSKAPPLIGEALIPLPIHPFKYLFI